MRRILRAGSWAAALVTPVWSPTDPRPPRVQVDLEMLRGVFPPASLLGQEKNFRKRDWQGYSFRVDLPRMADSGCVFVEGETCSKQNVPAPGGVCSGPHGHNLRRSM